MKVIKQIMSTTSVNSDEYSVTENVTKINYGIETKEILSSSRTKYSIMNPVDNRKYSAEETVKRIINLTEELTNYWKSSKSWTPIEASALLTKSRLDWQASLARQLKLFLDKSNIESGYLILGWTTLGSLTEGALKLFLSVYYKVYKTQNLAKEFKPVKDKKGNLIDPDGLMLDKLRLFFAERVFPKNAKEEWKKLNETDWLDWIFKIQKRRNAIHAFKDKEIGDIEEFHTELQNYLIFLRKINNGLPYPNENYMPAEHSEDKIVERISIETDNGVIKCVIKKGKLQVASKEDGNFFKEHLELLGEIEIIDKVFLDDDD
jgi:hypothetical protein